MKRIFTLILGLVAMVGTVEGQLVITNTSEKTENFGSLSSTGTAALPSGWRVSSATVYSGGTTATTLAYGTSGTGVVTSSSSGGVINWANGITASSTDRALGFLSTGTFTSPRSIMLEIENTSGGIITDLAIAFDYEKYRSGSRAFDMTFFHGSNGSTWTAATSGDQAYVADANNTVVNNPPTTISKSFSLTGLSIASGAKYYLRWTYTGLAGSSNAQGLGLDNFSLTPSILFTPTISVPVPTSLSGFSTTDAAASAAQTFTTSGTNLTANLVVSAPSGFEVRENGIGSFGSSVSFTPASGSVASKTIEVRIASGTAVGSPSGDVSITSTDATTRNVAVSGTVTSASSPIITSSTASLTSFGDVVFGLQSGESSFTVNGDNLTSVVTVTAPTHFQVSLASGSGFASSVELTQTGGNIDGEPTATVYVRLNPASAAGSVSGNVALSSTDATTQNVAVSGFAIDTQPSSSASALSFTSVTQTGFTINWTRGNGDSLLVVLRSGSTVDWDPIDNAPYVANSSFGSGTNFNSGNFVVYKGIGTSVVVTELVAGTTYHAELFEFNADGIRSQNYQSAGVTASQATAELVDFVALSTVGIATSENFNTLATSSTSSTMPTGWFFSETGTGANTTYAAEAGASNSGNTYSYGADSDRALGILRSGSVISTIGGKIRNNTGVAMTSVQISYTGETWRVGAVSRVDRLDFQYSTDATSLTTGTWIDFNNLDYANPGQATGSGSLQHSANITSIITGLNVASGSNIWIRWNDFDASGADDGMAIDDISIGVPFTPTTSLTGTAGWRLLSSPISGSTYANVLGPIWTQGATGADVTNGSTNVFWSQGSTSGSLVQTGVTDLTTVLTPGRGFAVYVFNDDNYTAEGGTTWPKTLSVTGTENAANTVYTPAWTSGTQYAIAGNPFASTIDWDDVTRGANVTSSVWVWNPATTTYDAYNTGNGNLTGGLIAPFQGFWMEYTGATSGLTFPAAAKSTGATFRGKEEASRRLVVRATDSAGSNQAWIALNEAATLGQDRFDAVKFTPLSADYIQAFTMVADKAHDINTLPIGMTETVEIPLGVTSTRGGTVTLDVQELSLPEGWAVSVRDNATGDVRAMNADFSYSYESSRAKAAPVGEATHILAATAPRFTLIIDPSKTTSVDGGPETVGRMELEQNYPNPFNPSTQIRFALRASHA